MSLDPLLALKMSITTINEINFLIIRHSIYQDN